MRMVIAGLALLLAVGACQRQNAATPGGDVETGAKGADTAALQPQMQNPPAAPSDTSAKTGANHTDTSKKP